ncbi:hypothetical protein E2C01_054112 [Portunus trituberculatus]|uniref:Uncharacterized protein n=1 Tax=Portunus trituberculatus TaxID=210409 RepID=A0A5B7GR26_PORTR|nr:hypothetical protein [Portunus trituberculatus]
MWFWWLGVEIVRFYALPLELQIVSCRSERVKSNQQITTTRPAHNITTHHTQHHHPQHHMTN